MKRGFFCGLIVGAVLASVGFIVRERVTARERGVARGRIPHTKGNQNEAHQWLLNPDFSLAMLYAEPEALWVQEFDPCPRFACERAPVFQGQDRFRLLSRYGSV
jgi:hypothetical protein